MAYLIVAADAPGITDNDGLCLIEFDTRRTRGDCREEAEIVADLIIGRHFDLSEGDRDSEPRSAVGDIH